MKKWHGVAFAFAGVALTACSGLPGDPNPPQRSAPAEVEFRGSDPTLGTDLAMAQTAQAPDTAPVEVAEPVTLPVPYGVADARGVVTYENFQVLQAQPGDTMTSIAQRLGISAVAFAEYNDLPVSHAPQTGTLLALEPRSDRYGVVLEEGAVPPRWSPTLASAAIVAARAQDSAEALPAPSPAPTAAVTPPPATPVANANAIREPIVDPSQPREGITPVRHDVAAGETVFSISRLYGVSATSIAAWNGFGANLSVGPGDVIYIPIALQSDEPAAPAPVIASPAPAAAPVAEPVLTPPEPQIAAPSETLAEVPAPEAPIITATPAPAAPIAAADTILSTGDPGETQIAPPPSAGDALPEETGRVEVPAPAALSEIAQDTALFVRPVAGDVVRPFSNAAGSARNDGIDFAATPGADVRAADAGQVVYVARSVGDFDNIIMIRHPNDLVTAYARLGDVRVARGDTVSRGQVIGDVAPSDTPSVQFQVLQNMSPVDPAPFL
ncbi:MAG: LysM peptidoglycan-binding domain-containing M23 family metallopeptidase [Pseudomonadota bacterium]